MDITFEVETTIFNLLLDIDTATFESDDVVNEIDWIVVGQFVESETENKSVKSYWVVDADYPLYNEIAVRL